MYDLTSILNHIDLEKTVSQFGYPDNHLSKVIARCSCGHSWNSKSCCLKKSLKKTGKIACQSCRSTELMKSPILRKYLSKVTKECWNDHDYRQACINGIKNNWHNPVYVETQRIARDTNGFRENNSRNRKKYWDDNRDRLLIECKDPVRRSKISNSVKQYYVDHPEYKEYQSNAALVRWSDPVYASKVKRGLNHYWENPDARDRASDIMQNVWKDDNYRSQRATDRSKQSSKESSLELITSKLLDYFRIQHYRQYPIGPWVFDFYIPESDLLIECQGSYWHSLTDTKRRDSSKNSYIKRFFPEFNLTYLYEHEFTNPEITINKILGSAETNRSVVLHDEDLELVEMCNEPVNKHGYSESELFLQAFHSAGYGRKSFATLGLRYKDELISVAKFTSPSKRLKLQLSLLNHNTLELDRIGVHSSYDIDFGTIDLYTKSVFETNKQIQNIIYVTNNETIRCWKNIGRIVYDYYLDDNNYVIMASKLNYLSKKLGMTHEEYASSFGYRKCMNSNMHIQLISR